MEVTILLNRSLSPIVMEISDMCNAKRNGSILMVLLAVFLICSADCGGRSFKRVGEEGEYEASREMSLNRSFANFDAAKEARMNGNFEKAASLFRALYENRKNDRKLRIESLFELGQIYSDLANPNRDYKQALELFETLISEFPKSDLIDTAHRRIEKVKGFTTN